MATQKQQLSCSCSSPEHVIQFMMDDDPDWDETYVYVHLVPDRFWKRVMNAIKYIFGYTSKYGCFDEVCLSPKELDDLVAFVNRVRDAKAEARSPGLHKEEWVGEPGSEVPCCSSQASGLSEPSPPKV